MARPTKFTQDLANTICKRIMEGESLRAICLDDAMPTRSSVHLWLANDTTFSDQYAKAKDTQADTLADELIHIADTAEDVNKARLQVDTRKWVASKLKPKKYGERIQHANDDDSPMPTPIFGGLSVKKEEDDTQ